MFNTLDIGASGLMAQRIRMDTVANNVLNMSTTRNERGESVPYQRRFVVFRPGQPGHPERGGVHVAKIEKDTYTPYSERYEPGHPDADQRGYVKYPNIELATEVVNMMDASRAYEANVTMMETTKAMLNASLRMLA